MNKIIVFLVATIALSSCGSDKTLATESSYIIRQDTLVQILKDIHLVDAAAKQNFLPNNADNYNKYKEYKAVLELHKVSKARFDSTISYYSLQNNKYNKLYETVILELKKEESAVQ